MRKPAAVLLGILDGQIVLTKRSANLRSFTGQVCLPGGQADNIDSGIVATAIREFNEEVYYDGKIEPLFCMLPEYIVVTAQAVYPVIAHLEGTIQGFNREEVAKIILLPRTKLAQMEFLLDPEHPQIKHNLCLNYADELIWGLTAYILHKFNNYYHNYF